MSALIRHVALVSQSQRTRTGDVMRVAAALQKQAVRDLAPLWDVSATIDAFERLEDVPLDYWPIIVMDDINEPGRQGRQGPERSALRPRDGGRHPRCLVADREYEALEMLVGPFGTAWSRANPPRRVRDGWNSWWRSATRRKQSILATELMGSSSPISTRQDTSIRSRLPACATRSKG